MKHMFEKQQVYSIKREQLEILLNDYVEEKYNGIIQKVKVDLILSLNIKVTLCENVKTEELPIFIVNPLNYRHQLNEWERTSLLEEVLGEQIKAITTNLDIIYIMV